VGLPRPCAPAAGPGRSHGVRHPTRQHRYQACAVETHPGAPAEDRPRGDRL